MGKKAAKHHLAYAYFTSTYSSFWITTPLATVGDAMMQTQKYKGGTAKQGLVSLLATLHCYTIWPSEAVPLSEIESNSDRAEHGFGSRKLCSKLTSYLFFLQGSDLSWPIPRGTVCHHQIAVLAQKVKTAWLPPAAPKSEETNPNGAWRQQGQ